MSLGARRLHSLNRAGRLRACPERSRMGQSPLPCHRGEHEKDAADAAEKQAHDPEPASLCKSGDRGDGNRDLEHGYAAREDFVLVKV